MSTKDAGPDGEEALVEFDQTNGVVGGLDGDSDGTAAGEQGRDPDAVSDDPMPLNRIGAYEEFDITGEAVDGAGNGQGVARKGFPKHD